MIRPRFRAVLVHALSLSLIFGIVWIHVLILSPEQFEDIKGRKFNDKVPKDLLDQVVAAIDSGNSFECSEEALNQYMGSIINVIESEEIKKFSKFNGLFVRLLEGEFDLVFVREVFGKTFTSSVRFVMGSTDSGIEIRVKSGRYGMLQVPSGFMNLMRSSIMGVGNVLGVEKKILSRPLLVKLKDGWIQLDPRSRLLTESQIN
ncbi:MAG: hypothetical protein HN584_04375 [Akkermansiaceae bacterium]|nr:hypothetical protein [Akkermansiaceae bacterium]